MGFSGPIFIF